MNDQYNKIKLFRKYKNYINELTENFKFNKGRYPTNIELSEILNFYTGISFFTTSLINESVADNTINSFTRRLVVLCEGTDEELVNYVESGIKMGAHPENEATMEKYWEAKARLEKSKLEIAADLARKEGAETVAKEAELLANDKTVINRAKEAEANRPVLDNDPIELENRKKSSKNAIKQETKKANIDWNERKPPTEIGNQPTILARLANRLVGGSVGKYTSDEVSAGLGNTTTGNVVADATGNLVYNAFADPSNAAKQGKGLVGGALGSFGYQAMGGENPYLRQASSLGGNILLNTATKYFPPISDSNINRNIKKGVDYLTKTPVSKVVEPVMKIVSPLLTYGKKFLPIVGTLLAANAAKASYDERDDLGVQLNTLSGAPGIGIPFGLIQGAREANPILNTAITNMAGYETPKQRKNRNTDFEEGLYLDAKERERTTTGPPKPEDAERIKQRDSELAADLKQQENERQKRIATGTNANSAVLRDEERIKPQFPIADPQTGKLLTFESFRGASSRMWLNEQRVPSVRPIPEIIPEIIPANKELKPVKPETKPVSAKDKIRIELENKLAAKEAAEIRGMNPQPISPFAQDWDNLISKLSGWFSSNPEEVALETQREEAARLAKIRAENPLAPEVQPAPVQKNYTREFFPYIFPDTDQSFTRILPATEPPVEEPTKAPTKKPDEKETPAKAPTKKPDEKETPAKAPDEKPAKKNPKKIDTKEYVKPEKKDPKPKDPTSIIPIPPPGRFGGGSFRDSKSFVSEPETNPQDAPGERWWALVAPGSEAAIRQIQESRSGKLNTKSAIQSRVKKQQYKITVTENSKKLEIFASSIRGIRRAVYGKKNYRVFDSKGSDITNYFKRLMATKKST